MSEIRMPGSVNPWEIGSDFDYLAVWAWVERAGTRYTYRYVIPKVYLDRATIGGWAVLSVVVHTMTDEFVSVYGIDPAYLHWEIHAGSCSAA